MYGTLNLVPEGKQVWELVCLGSPLQQLVVFQMEGEAEVEIIIRRFWWDFGLKRTINLPKLLLSATVQCVTGELHDCSAFA